MNTNKIALFLLSQLFCASLLCAAPAASSGITKSTETNNAPNQTRKVFHLKDRLKSINSAAASESKESLESLQVLEEKIDNDIKDVEVDQDFIKSARDKSLNWKTRYLLIEHVNAASEKKTTKDEEVGLYSDALLDAQEHTEIRKLAARSLMEPARTEKKARETLAKAAKDKAIPGEILQSVMVSVGSSGIDDTDILAGLMDREPKTNNEVGINLNAVRALRTSKDPRAVGMLFKIMDESKPDSFYNMTALEQFSALIQNPVKEKELRPMLVPRLMKLLEDRRSHFGASRQLAGRMLVRMHERKAIPPIMKWLKPRAEGGGWGIDVIWGAEILAEFKATEAIPELQKIIDNFNNDPRWEEYKQLPNFKNGTYKFPEDTNQYPHIKECLKKLKGDKYNKSMVALPMAY